MPLELDKTDVSILKALMRDGRLPFRQIAVQVGVSPPTVESRLKKMTDSGIIRKIAPILDINKVDRGVSVLLMLKVELARVNLVIEKLVPLDEVRSVFSTTGEANVTLRVAASTNETFQDFLDNRIAPLEVGVISSSSIMRTAKDEQGIALYGEMEVALVCAYCGREISGMPFTLNAEEVKKFFCCKTCLMDYKEKYRLAPDPSTGTDWNS